MNPSWSQRLLLLSNAEVRRAVPFFALYILVFAVLTIAEGISMALFVQRVGAEALPQWYAAMAAANLVLVGGYVLLAKRFDSARLFSAITGGSALVFFVVWLLLREQPDSNGLLGTLFAAREIAYTLFLMHFGTFLQDFFSRSELLRVMPIVYAGGRVGGIAGGASLALFSGYVPLQHLLLLCSIVAAVAALAAFPIARFAPRAAMGDEETSAEGVAGGGGRTADELDREGRDSWRGFVRFLRTSPLGYWYTLLSFVYVPCRWVLNYQYNLYFESHFDDEAAMARFLGLYTQAGLALSLVLQLLVIGRFVQRFGLHVSQIVYAVALVAGMLWLPLRPSLAAAAGARFVESELRFGWRNPINQLIVNKFSRLLRIRMRAWSIGALIPIGTMLSAGGLTMIARSHHAWLLGATGVGLSLAYFHASLRLGRTFRERPSVPPTSSSPASPADGASSG
jgi:ATP/ADP translocase